MRKYNFKLQRILDFREHIEKIRQLELAKVQMRLKDAHEALSQLFSSLREYQRELQTLEQQSTIDINFSIQYHVYLMELMLRIDEQQKAIQTLEEEEEEQRQLLLAASKDKKILEKLKEREYSEFMEAFLKFEQNTIDEVAVNSYRRLSRDDDTEPFDKLVTTPPDESGGFSGNA